MADFTADAKDISTDPDACYDNLNVSMDEQQEEREQQQQQHLYDDDSEVEHQRVPQSLHAEAESVVELGGALDFVSGANSTGSSTDLLQCAPMDAGESDSASKPKNASDPTDFKKQNGKQESYILGTLIVRVVAARNLQRSSVIFGDKTVHSYASVRFGQTTQRTSIVYDCHNPLWPRGESLFMDVVTTSPPPEYLADNEEQAPSSASEDPPPPVLTVATFHAGASAVPKKKKGMFQGDSDDVFLGATAPIYMTQLLTGHVHQIDKWVTLSGGANDTASIRIVCEYESADSMPEVGDMVRLTEFCDSADIYPLSRKRTYRVVEILEDDMMLVTWTTPENWQCTAGVHRNSVYVVHRKSGVTNFLPSLKDRLAQSALVDTVAREVCRVPDDGLLDVGQDVLKGAMSTWDRWNSGGNPWQAAWDDVRQVTNWDGTHAAAPVSDFDDTEEDSTEAAMTVDPLAMATVPEVPIPDTSNMEALPNMPACPITGQPMIDPVVAADGHTYERAAIARWFQTSRKSPLTGAVLAHTDLVPNYMLLSSLSEADQQRQSKQDKAIEEDAEDENDSMDEVTTEIDIM